MKILDRLPISDEHHFVGVGTERVKIRPYQIIIRISVLDGPVWDPRAPIFPALLDTGNNLNFSIQEVHLRRWAGIHPQSLTALKVVREAGRSPSLRAATVWIHPNGSGTRDLKAADPFALTIEPGISTYPTGGTDYPRLPLLGLRAIVESKLKLTIDGNREHVSLRSPFWRR